MPILFYKNSARLGAYVDCKISQILKHETCTVEQCIQDFNEKDCILPSGVSPSALVYPCTLRLRMCNDQDETSADAIQSVSPELFLRTDRGAWSVFHERSIYLLPDHDVIIQLSTKERSNIMRASFVIEFCCGDRIIAKSEILLVLSKPPLLHKHHPFARILQESKARELGLMGFPCKASRWMKCNEGNVIIPELPSANILACTVHSLGSYRTKPSEVSLKRARIDDSNEVDELRIEILHMKQKLNAIEHEKLGLVKALRLLAQD